VPIEFQNLLLIYCFSISIELAEQGIHVFLADAFKDNAWRKTQSIGKLEGALNVKSGYYRRKDLRQQALIESGSAAKIHLSHSFGSQVLTDQLCKLALARVNIRRAI
jgi:hypothetical protein